jgi:hypothetical protein
MDLDTNIDHWSVDDILELLGLTHPSKQEIIANANRLIEYERNPDLIVFLKKARDKAIQPVSFQEDDSFEEQASEQLLEWKKNQYIPQKDPIQSSKVTSRNNKVNLFEDGTHFQMKRESIGVNQSYNVPVMQGTINPNLKNIVERTVLIDSQYRPIVLPYSHDCCSSSFNTNFTVDLTDTLQNVLSMELYSIQLPKSWFNISSSMRNNSVQIGTEWSVPIPDGYYTIDTFFNESPNESTPFFSRTLQGGDDSVVLSYNTSLNRVFVQTATNTPLTWFSNQTTIPSGANAFVNDNLGWLLGFRTINENGDLVTYNVGTMADASPNFIGPQYFLLSVDDYQHNRINKAIVGTVEPSIKLDIPSYNNSDNLTLDTDGNCVAVATAARKLTQAQIYTINTIYANRRQKKTRSFAPTTNNVLAVIPLSGRQTHDPLVMFGTTMPWNMRSYFGPVTIERLSIKLVDDKGNLVHLDGVDWSFTLTVKQLYQY